MNNTIILLKGEAYLTRREYKEFEKGDTIFCGSVYFIAVLEAKKKSRSALPRLSLFYFKNSISAVSISSSFPSSSQISLGK